MSLFGSRGRKPRGARPAGVRQRTEAAAAPTDRPESRARRPRKAPQPQKQSEQRAEGDAMASFGKSIIFKGDLTGDEDLEIEGRVEGQIQLPNHQLTIGAHGRVTAQIEAKLVVVIGHVAGNVTASERVEVQASGIVDGDIQAPRLLIQEGAVVNGSIQMGSAPPAASAQSVSSTASESETPRKTG